MRPLRTWRRKCPYLGDHSNCIKVRWAKLRHQCLLFILASKRHYSAILRIVDQTGGLLSLRVAATPWFFTFFLNLIVGHAFWQRMLLFSCFKFVGSGVTSPFCLFSDLKSFFYVLCGCFVYGSKIWLEATERTAYWDMYELHA